MTNTPIKLESTFPCIPSRALSEATLIPNYIPRRWFCLFLNFIWMKSYYRYSLISDFFHSTWYFWDLSGLLGASVAHFFVLMKSILMYKYNATCLSIFWASFFFLVTSLVSELGQVFAWHLRSFFYYVELKGKNQGFWKDQHKLHTCYKWKPYVIHAHFSLGYSCNPEEVNYKPVTITYMWDNSSPNQVFVSLLLLLLFSVRGKREGQAG